MVFEIDFWKTFDSWFLPKIKLRRVKLKILQTDVLKCKKGSDDFSAVVLLGVGNMNTSEKNYILKIDNFSDFPNRSKH